MDAPLPTIGANEPVSRGGRQAARTPTRCWCRRTASRSAWSPGRTCSPTWPPASPSSLGRASRGHARTAIGESVHDVRVQDRRPAPRRRRPAGSGPRERRVGVDRPAPATSRRQHAARRPVVGQRARLLQAEAARRARPPPPARPSRTCVPGDPEATSRRPCRAPARRRRLRPSRAPSGPARTAGRSTPAPARAAAAGRRSGVRPRRGAARSDRDQRVGRGPRCRWPCPA